MIVGVSGKAGAGKDTVADILVKNHKFVKVAFADPLKRICRDVYDFTDEQLWGPSENRNAPDKRYPRQPLREEFIDGDRNEYLTPRYALQKLGTEWGRDCYQNTWVDLALRTAKKLAEEGGYTYTAKGGLEHHWRRGDQEAMKYPVVIPDLRFQNEIDAIKAAGGKVVRLYRNAPGLISDAGYHRSETEQDGIPDSAFDHIIENNSDLHWLYMLTDRMMDFFKGKIMEYDEDQADIPPFMRKKRV